MPTAPAKPNRSKASHDPLPALNAAADRLERGEHETALVSLLEAWREHGDPRIADAIDRLSAIVTEEEKPIVAVGGTSAKTAWYTAAKSQRPAVLGRLLETVPEGLDRIMRLDALLKWPPDPRIGTAARAWIDAPPVKNKNRPGFFNGVWKLIDYTRDVRLVPIVTKISTDRSGSVRAYGLKSWVALTELAERVEQLPKPAPLNPNTIQALERVEARLAKPVVRAAGGTSANEAELYDRIYADPTDDEARTVLSDLLQQRGDPRGEFIALQLARHGTGKPATSAEKKLQQQWGRTWLGPLLDAALAKGELEFERGFVARARYLGGSDGVPSIGAREWSTMTHLDCSQASGYTTGSAKLLVTPPCRNLRHVTGISPSDYELLATLKTLPWETIGWRVWSFDSLGKVFEDGAGQRFASVRRFIIEGASSGAEALSSEILALLEKWPNVEVYEHDADADHALRLLVDPRGKRLKRLVLNGTPMILTIEGDTFTFGVRYLNEESVAQIVNLMGALSPKKVALAAGNKGVLEKGYLLKAKYASVSVKKIIDAAKKSKIPLDVQGTTFAP